MNQLRTTILAAVAAPALLAGGLSTADIVFSPAEGHSVTRTWTNTAQFALDDLQMSMNGQPLPMEIEMEMDMENSTEVEVTDQYVAMADGRPGQLKRTFDSLATTGSFSMEMEMMPGGGQSQDITASSELEGKTVMFTWDEDSGEYDVAFHESEGDDELLEGLEEDMDLRALLPSGSVSEGDTWDIDVKELTSVMAPGGNMALVPDMDGAEMGMPGMNSMGGSMSDMIGDSFEGSATGTYKGTQDIDGVTVAVIALEFDVESSNDMTEMVLEQMDEMPEEMQGMEMDIEYMDVEMDIEAEGILYWDISANHAHSMTVSGNIGMVMDMSMSMAQGGQEMQMEQTFEMSGSFENAMSVAIN